MERVLDEIDRRSASQLLLTIDIYHLAESLLHPHSQAYADSNREETSINGLGMIPRR